MIPALFALAAAMVIGGCAAVVQGFPYVRLESGLALVIAGSVAASSGTVLFGLGVVAAGLRRVERAAGRTSRAPEAGDAPLAGARPRLPPVLPVAAPPVVTSPVVTSPVVLSPSEPAFASELRRIEPSLERSEDRALGAPPPADAEPELPIPGLAPAPPVPEPVPEPVARAADVSPEDDLFAAPEAAGTGPALRPGLDAAAPIGPEPSPPEPPEPATRAVVGRYASGGNTYVMYEDGTIEAETPQGRFTFASLDELKAFVDGGGETRGAA